MNVRTQTDAAGRAAPRRDGALHLRPSARLPDLRRQRRLRAAGHGRRGRPARGPLRLRRREPPRSAPTDDNPTPTSTSIPSKCIVCSRCVRACEEVQGTFALTIDGPRLRLEGRRRAWTSRFLESECVSCGACVQACPTATLTEKSGDRDRPARALGGHHLRLLRRRLHLQGRDARRASSCAWSRTRTARPTTATPASRAASPGATPTIRTASSSR